jgi:hypothetical protein
MLLCGPARGDLGPTMRRSRARILVVFVLATCGGEDGTAQTDAATSTSMTSDTGPPDTLDGTASTTTTGGSAGSESSGSDTSAGSTGEPPYAPPDCPQARTELDLPDDSPEPQVRVLYVLPSDSIDDELDTDGKLCNSVLGWTQWLREQTEGRSLRLDTADDVLDIGFVRLGVTDAVMHGTSTEADIATGVAYVRDRIEQELLSAGILVPHKIYAVYYGGTSEYACGGGAYPPLIIDQVGAMYLGGMIPGYPPCDDSPWGEADLVPRYIDYGMLHELVHTLGIVDLLALHQHSVGHTFDDGQANPERDLLYSQRPGMNDPPWGVYAPGGLVLDLGRDDYFEQSDPRIVDLARSVFLDPMPPDAMAPPGW